MKTIDFKSFAIGILLCVVLLFSTGFQFSGKRDVSSCRAKMIKGELGATTTGDPFAVTFDQDGRYLIWFKN